MRLTSEFFTAALIRRANGAGAFAALRRRGGSAAGAIFVLVDSRDGTGALFGPALQGDYAGGDSERAFRRLHPEPRLPVEALESRLEKEARFDPDLWIVEIEDREGRPFLDRLIEDFPKGDGR